jgi:hypothetical protein
MRRRLVRESIQSGRAHRRHWPRQLAGPDRRTAGIQPIWTGTRTGGTQVFTEEAALAKQTTQALTGRGERWS